MLGRYSLAELYHSTLSKLYRVSMPNQIKNHLYFLHSFPVRKCEVCYALWILQCDSPRADREYLPTPVFLVAGSLPLALPFPSPPKNASDMSFPFFLSLHQPASPHWNVSCSEGRCSEGAQQHRAMRDRKPFTLISPCRSLAFLRGAVSPLMRSTYPALPSHLARPSLLPSPAGMLGFSRGSRCLEEAGRGYVRR